CVPCSVPGHLLWPIPASGFCVPVPVTSGHTGTAGGGKFEHFKKCHFFPNKFYIVKHCCFKPFHIHFVPMLCPVPCLHFVCSFCLETEKRPCIQKVSL
ncbi:unnamed protein product, partial [Staurois parvus]